MLDLSGAELIVESQAVARAIQGVAVTSEQVTMVVPTGMTPVVWLDAPQQEKVA